MMGAFLHRHFLATATPAQRGGVMRVWLGMATRLWNKLRGPDITLDDESRALLRQMRAYRWM